MYKCLNPECGRTFPILGRISKEKKPTTYTSEYTRIIIESPCCPYCGCLEFEEVKEPAQK